VESEAMANEATRLPKGPGFLLFIVGSFPDGVTYPSAGLG
jgi:hypothetical protein